MAFGVVLFTLLVQGISMDWVVKKLKLVQRSHFQEEYERRHARFVAGRAAYDYLRRMNQQGLISEHTWQRLAPVMERQNDMLVEAVKQVITSDPAVEAEELDTAHREALRAQRSALTGLLRDGVISEENILPTGRRGGFSPDRTKIQLAGIVALWFIHFFCQSPDGCCYPGSGLGKCADVPVQIGLLSSALAQFRRIPQQKKRHFVNRRAGRS